MELKLGTQQLTSQAVNNANIISYANHVFALLFKRDKKLHNLTRLDANARQWWFNLRT